MTAEERALRFIGATPHEVNRETRVVWMGEIGKLIKAFEKAQDDARTEALEEAARVAYDAWLPWRGALHEGIAEDTAIRAADLIRRLATPDAPTGRDAAAPTGKEGAGQ